MFINVIILKQQKNNILKNREDRESFVKHAKEVMCQMCQIWVCQHVKHAKEVMCLDLGKHLYNVKLYLSILCLRKASSNIQFCLVECFPESPLCLSKKELTAKDYPALICSEMKPFSIFLNLRNYSFLHYSESQNNYQ